MIRNFIYVLDSFLSEEESSILIDIYKNNKPYESARGNYTAVVLDDVILKDNKLNFFNGRIQKVLNEYISLYPELKFVSPFSLTELRLKCWKSGNYFNNWHSEHSLETPHRILNFMVYLSNHNCGTEFLNKTKVLSKTGRLLIMPSYFTHTHRGMICPEGKDRYVLSGYFNFTELSKK
tara:strand:+ start:218 stop:751 length:534 start_codon:yes stop_codon:yes gene_type:complete